MKQEYENIIQSVCSLRDWRRAGPRERDGAIGVAIVMAYLNGIRANLRDMADHLELSEREIRIPYERLLINGIFSQRFNLREDSTIVGYGKETEWMGRKESTRNAWCILAGIAGGFTGLRETR